MTVTALYFVVSLIPTILDPTSRIPISSSLPLGIALLASAAAQVKLKLTWPGILTALTGASWLVVAVLRH